MRVGKTFPLGIKLAPTQTRATPYGDVLFARVVVGEIQWTVSEERDDKAICWLLRNTDLDSSGVPPFPESAKPKPPPPQAKPTTKKKSKSKK